LKQDIIERGIAAVKAAQNLCPEVSFYAEMHDKLSIRSGDKLK